MTQRPPTGAGGGRARSGDSPGDPQPRRAVPGASRAAGEAAAPRHGKISPLDGRRAVLSRGGTSAAWPAGAQRGMSRRGAESPILDRPPSALPAGGTRQLPELSPVASHPRGRDRAEQTHALGTPHPPQKIPGATSPFPVLGKMMLPRHVPGVFPSESKSEIKEHLPEREGTLFI